MASGDGLLARITPTLATLSAAQALALDQAASRDGNGIIEITSRGNLQARGLRPASHGAFLAILADAGLIDSDPRRQARRRLSAAPLAATDPDAQALFRAVQAALLASNALDGSPKFSIRVEGGPISTHHVPCDMRLERRGNAVSLVMGGLMALVPAFDAARVTVSLTRAVMALGASRVRDLSADAIDTTFQTLGLAAHGFDHAPGSPPEPIGALTSLEVIGVAPAFGALGEGELADIGRLSLDFGDGALRITPFRSILLAGVTRPEPALARAETLGLVIDAGDIRRRVHACAGAPSCASALQPARSAAMDLLHLVPASGVLHISGCAKGCAHPSPAAVTLVGTGSGYRKVLDGRAG